jgi:hypothetical protein
MILNASDLNFWLKFRLNVLMEGKHGVGKTGIIEEFFTREFGEIGQDWLYLSGSTMDPWVDFIGVPREVMDENGEPYLQLVRPKAMRDGKVKAIFIDEYNRSHPKVRNAVMELIQFRRINGHKFPNLQVVWAAVNPDNGDYDTEAVDPAQQDRFDVQVAIPYKPDEEYFAKKYGANWAEAACAWWKSLGEDWKDKISPRRLDKALFVKKNGGKLSYILPEKCGIQKLSQDLSEGPAERRLKELFAKNDVDGLRKFLVDGNNYDDCKEAIIEKDERLRMIFPMLHRERQVALIHEEPRVKNYVFNNAGFFQPVLATLATSSQNEKTKKEAQAKLDEIMGATVSTATPTDNPFAGDFGSEIAPSSRSAVANTMCIRVDSHCERMPITGSTRSIGNVSINDVRMAINGSTDAKKNLLENDVATCVHEKMSKEEAIYAGRILDLVASRSHARTMMQLPIVPFINTLVHVLGYTVDEMCEAFPNLMVKVVDKVLQENPDLKGFVFKRI